jgi:hypothetical protein
MTSRWLGACGCLFLVLIATSVTIGGSDGAISGANTGGGPCPIQPLASTEYGEIKRALEYSPPVITSTESLIACLPAEFFRQGNLTFVTRSGSPEGASVSNLFPRTILFGDTAQTVIAYTGDPGGPHAEEVRIIAVGDATPPRYRFVSVTFPGQGQAPRIDESDDRCAVCHKGHLIWSNYRDWDGTFGRNSDLVWQEKDRDDYDAYQRFLVARAGSPRYGRAIQSVRGDRPHAAATGSQFTPRNPYVPGAANFLRKLAPTQARFVKGRLEQSQLYPSYKFLLAATFLACQWSAHVEADFNTRVVALFEGEAVWSEHRTYLQQLQRAPQDNYFLNLLSIARLSMLGRGLNVSMDEWSTERTGSRTFEAFGPAFDLASGIEIRDFVFREWIAGLGREVKPIGQAFSGPKWNPRTKYSSYLNPRYRYREPGPDPNHTTECAALLPFLEAEVNDRALADQLAVPIVPAPERARPVAPRSVSLEPPPPTLASNR